MENKHKLNILQGQTCFSVQQKFNTACQRKSCNNWFPDSKCLNCSIIGAQSSPWTLQEVGAAYGLTRMRICQIEKKILFKIKEKC